uniref:Equilibrative nucleoside transporter 3 n=1 Tax=Ascaris lumbricoides TaxID=6252 RepID=A0A9J2P8K1_ASCLU
MSLRAMVENDVSFFVHCFSPVGSPPPDKRPSSSSSGERCHKWPMNKSIAKRMRATIARKVVLLILPAQLLMFASIASGRVASTTSAGESEGEEPEDRYNLVYLTMMLHGIGILIPWSSFITIAVEYYVCFKLRKLTPHGGEETPYARDFLKYLATASQGPNLLLNMLNLFLTFRGGLAARIFVCIIIVCVICAITMAFIFIDTSSWIGGFFWLTMVLVVLLNAANGVYQNSLFGIAADLPPNVTASIMIGNNLCGVFCAIVAMITRAGKLVKITVFNFMVSLFALLLCHLSTFKYTFQAFYQYHVNKVGKEKRKGGTSKEIQDDSDKRTTEEIFDKLSDYYEVVKTASYIFTFICFYFLGLLFVGFVYLLYIPHTDSCVCSSSMGAKQTKINYLGGVQLLNVWLVLFVSLAVFPAIQAEVRPRDDFIIPKEYFELITSFFSFGFFAMCGAMLSNWIQWVCFPSLCDTVDSYLYSVLSSCAIKK